MGSKDDPESGQANWPTIQARRRAEVLPSSNDVPAEVSARERRGEAAVYRKWVAELTWLSNVEWPTDQIRTPKGTARAS